MALPRVLMKVYEFLNDRLALDYRSLAWFRFGLGATIFADCLVRASDMEVFYTDNGVVSRYDLMGEYGNIWHTCFHAASGQIWFEYLLFAVMAIFALMLMVGYRTRTALIVTWILNLSVQARNPLVLHGGDNLLRLLLFFALFLPLASAFSVDKALDDNTKPRPGHKIWNGATMALVWQIMIMYFFAAYAKKGAEWVSEGSAVHYALNIDQLTTYLGDWILHNLKDYLYIFSFGTLYLEAYGPYLFITPFFVGPLRTLGVLLFVSLHIGFGTCMELGIFPWLDSFAVMAFLPTWFWDKLFGWLKTPKRTGLKIYYDGECNFCKKLVAILHTFFCLPEVQVAPAQSESGIQSSMERENSWVVVDYQGKEHYQYDGFLALVKASPLLCWFHGIFNFAPIKNLGQSLYLSVAQKRMNLAPLLADLQFKPMNHRVPLWANYMAIFFMVYISFWNWDNVFKKPNEPFRFTPMGVTLGLDQGWGMFAPWPLKRDGWWVVEGKLMGGETIEVLTGKKGPVSFEKPTTEAYMYKNERWRKYMMGLYSANNMNKQLEGFAGYLCRSWNRDKMEENLEMQLDSFKIYFMSEITAPPDKPPNPAQKNLVWTHFCFSPADKVSDFKI
jgi:predicted DCC family thiol-disulfide oxidoreductase YuxK